MGYPCRDNEKPARVRSPSGAFSKTTPWLNKAHPLLQGKRKWAANRGGVAATIRNKKAVGEDPFSQFRAHTVRMADQWTENLRCPLSRETGVVSLSQGDGDNTPTVQSISEGFKVVMTPHGPDFYCGTCDVAAEP